MNRSGKDQFGLIWPETATKTDHKLAKTNHKPAKAMCCIHDEKVPVGQERIICEAEHPHSLSELILDCMAMHAMTEHRPQNGQKQPTG